MVDEDPITRLGFEEPVLASDGYTYSWAALFRVVSGDPYHRSPVTQEVLRPVVFANTVAPGWAPGQPRVRTLWHRGDGTVPADGTLLQITAPPTRSTTLAAALLACRLDGVPLTTPLVFSCTVTLSGGTAWLMHPPPAETVWDAAAALCVALLGKNAVANPWALGTAPLMVGDRATTIEDQCVNVSGAGDAY